MALITASVPELTIRIISMDGRQALIISPRVSSLRVGAPKERPSAQASCTARITGSQPCPRIQGPQEST